MQDDAAKRPSYVPATGSEAISIALPAIDEPNQLGERAKPLLSVIIKAYNEENKIGDCLRSVLEATTSFPTQIIVADARSVDATTEIAKQFGVNVVALAPDVPRGCGVGAQLGFQHTTGQYILLIDGDMRLDPSFLPQALEALEVDSSLAGVGGCLELDDANLEYRLRRGRNMQHLRPGFVERLDGGGLYRRTAIESVGYFTDQNLHSFEELDLGLRLQQSGWRLRRIEAPAFFHRGHTVPAFPFLLQRWRSYYTDGQGEALRAALGSRRVIALAREFRISLFVLVWWITIVLYITIALPLGFSFLHLIALALLPFLTLILRKRSIVLASYSFLQWQVIAAGMIRGMLRSRREPTLPIPATILNTATDFPVNFNLTSETKRSGKSRPLLPDST